MKPPPPLAMALVVALAPSPEHRTVAKKALDCWEAPRCGPTKTPARR